MNLILHGYWRSSAAYRVRIALNIKGLAYETREIDLRTGVQRSAAYAAVNPQSLVPALECEDGVLTQSLAIIEWLEERFPQPALLPTAAPARAQARAMALIVAADIHPLNNLRVLQALEHDFGADESQRRTWIEGWIRSGFDALERLIERHGGDWAFGHAPSVADCCLIPQVYNAQRFKVALEAYPRILAINERAAAHPAFHAAHPDRQAAAR